MSRPIFHFNMKKVIDSKLDLDMFLDLADFLNSYTFFHALVPGKVETWNLVVDFKDLGLSQIPMNQLRMMSMRMKKNYKLRVHNIVAVNTSWVIKQAANIINTFLDARLTNKIKIFTDNGNQFLDKLVGKDHLE